MSDYTPNPIDTSDVVIDSDLLQLIEKLAENTHENWARGRKSDGWTYGEVRDDINKEHPCLIPYAQLSESEKDYDRHTALETLKLISKLGYHITSPDTLNLPKSFDAEIELIKSALNNKKTPLSTLLEIWKSHNQILWKGNPQLYLQLGKKFLNYGEALFAYDVLDEGLTYFPVPELLDEGQRELYICMSYYQALALTETGAANEAEHLLHYLVSYTDDEIQFELSGLLGRIYKGLGHSEQDKKRSADYLKKSYGIYYSAFLSALSKNDLENAYYHGINSAALALFSSDFEQSIKIAKDVKNICRTVIGECQKNNKSVQYWLYATLGETELLIGNMVEAKSQYVKAMQLAENDLRGRLSIYRQIKYILPKKGYDVSHFDDCLNLPAIIVFSGHMIDAENTSNSRFPVDKEDEVREYIGNILDGYKNIIAYSSAAFGSDIIFLEEVLKRDGELNVILPFDSNNFKKTSVCITDSEDWEKRFDCIMENATRISVLSQYLESASGLLYDFANKYIYGIAKARSVHSGLKIECIGVWDGVHVLKPGNACSAIQLWSTRGEVVKIIHPLRGLVKNGPQFPVEQIAIQSKGIYVGESDTRYYNYLPLLFADIKGYSKLDEQQLISFSVFYLSIINQIFGAYGDEIKIKRTQGDGLFVVFNSIAAAANFSYDLMQLLENVDWTEYKLPEDLAIRISLDAGPCSSYFEPVTQRLEFCGDYVNRAARIEPITPPGKIYVSESFASLAYAESLANFKLVYAGQVVLPKGHGIIPAYHLYKE